MTHFLSRFPTITGKEAKSPEWRRAMEVVINGPKAKRRRILRIKSTKKL